MDKQEIVHTVLKEKLVIIIRSEKENDIPVIINAAVKGGVKVLEITSNSINFEDNIRKAREQYPHILIGAGTIHTMELAQKAIAAGAQFLVTPNTIPPMADYAHDNGIPVMMGAYTPSEVAAAINAGADIVKLFPAESMGITYFKSIKGPFHDHKYFAVGGIRTNSIAKWLDAGIDGFGMGGSLVKLEEGKYSAENITLEMRKIIKLLQ